MSERQALLQALVDHYSQALNAVLFYDAVLATHERVALVRTLETLRRVLLRMGEREVVTED